MTGRYLIYIPVESGRDEKRFDAAWGKFADLCRSLHREGLSYDVQLHLNGHNPYVLITAFGKAVAQRSSTRRAFALSQPVPVERCRERALEASWFLPENRERRNSNTTHWRKRQARYAELSAMAEEHLRAEFEFWRELEALSGQRQHFKPGLTDETACADDEVAA